MTYSSRKITLILSVTVTILLIAWVAYIVINDTITNLVEQQSISMAEVVSQQALTSRAIHGAQISNKLSTDGFNSHKESQKQQRGLPLPEQSSKTPDKTISGQNARLYEYRPVSKWNIEPTQGVTDDFLRWAWPRLELQDQKEPFGPIAWKPIWRIEIVEGVKVLRYLMPDPAISPSCVSCHNEYEKMPEVIAMREKNNIPAGKNWKQHQLLGALYVKIPLAKVEMIAEEQIHRTVQWTSAILVSSLVIIVGFLIRNFRYVRHLTDLSWVASHDPLTSLVNRRGFWPDMRQHWESAIRNHKEHILCLIDLDGFKLVNDTYGHQIGDELLVNVSANILNHVRKGDVVARLGGDEFAIILGDCSIEQGLIVAENIRSAICDTKVSVAGAVVQASIGLAQINGRLGVDQIFGTADKACYAAKNKGKNCVHYES